MRKRLTFSLAAGLAFFPTMMPIKAEPLQLSYDGIRLNGELTIPEGGSLTDGVVLITHGSLAHHEMEIVVALRESLFTRNIASLAISLGFNVDDRKGFYDCAAGTNTHQRYDAVDEIRAWVDWLKERGVGGIAVMGHSAGGNQIAVYAAEHPDPAVRAVVLLAPGAYHAATQAASYRSRFGRDLAPLLAQAKAMAPEGVLEDVPFIRCETAIVSAASFLSYYAPDRRGDTPSVVQSIERPVLVISGSRDTVVGDLADTFGPLAGDRVEFVVVDGADHFFLDLFMEDVADTVAAFLEKNW